MPGSSETDGLVSSRAGVWLELNTSIVLVHDARHVGHFTWTLQQRVFECVEGEIRAAT